ncbi:MAG: SDR family oxidoreductase [Steroidobacteraceae bacterium]
MTIIVTGASGAFGRAAATQLIDTVGGANVILTTRTPAKLADLAARGAQVRYADFDDPSTLDTAFAGGERMLLISTARVGSRVGQHSNAIDAARRIGAKQIVYTSLLNADKDGNPAIVKLDHRATEELIERSGVPYTFLRDSQYSEAIAMAVIPPALINGSLPDNAHDGGVAFVSRDDCIACAVAVLTTPGHENKAYDITGPELLSFPKALAMAAEIAGRPLAYRAVSDEQMFEYFDSLGVPRHASDEPTKAPIPWSSDDMVTFGQSIREGYFDVCSDVVERLTGRKPRTLRSVLLQYQDQWPKAAP